MDNTQASNGNDGSIDLASYWSDVVDDLKDASDDPVKTAVIADAFCSTLAKAVDEGEATPNTVDALLGQFAKNAGIKKSKAEETYSTKLANRRTPATANNGSSDGTPDHVLGPVNFFMRDYLKRLIIYDPEDASVDAKYMWVFELDSGEELRVETEREHLAPNSMKVAIHTASGSRYSVEGPENLKMNWDDWVMEFVASVSDTNRSETIVLDGERSEAVRDLKNFLENTPATLDLTEAVQQYRPHLESEDTDRVIVPKPLIERVLSNFETVGFEDLQIELEERDLRTRNNKGTQIGRGKNVRLWFLARDWLDLEVEVPDDDDEDGDSEVTEATASGENE